MSADAMTPEPLFKVLDDDDIKAIVSAEIRDSQGSFGTGTQVQEDRELAMKLYWGRPFGNEVPGRSKVVLTELADTIHWIMPSLMRMFASDVVWEFEATDESAVEEAKQATEFINKEFWDSMDGFNILYEWFFTALLENTGIVKPEWEELVEPRYEKHQGLTRVEYESMLSDPTKEVRVVEFAEREQKMGRATLTLYDCTTLEVKRSGRIRVRGVPPEEFMIAKRDHRCDDDVAFVGERSRMTSSDLIAMGFDPAIVKKLPHGDTRTLSLAAIERERRNGELTYQSPSRPDEASKQHWVNDVWIRVDQDGDGYAELRNVIAVGEESVELLHNDYANFQPFCTLTPVPIPFRFIGQGMADLVGDLQLIRSTIFRQMLDNLYLINNNRMKVLEGYVEMEDLLTSQPGGVIRMQTLDAVMPLEQAPLPRDAYMMLDKLDEIRQIRTGVAANGMGVSADAGSLSSTASGANLAFQAANARVELIGRIFAETGVKQLGKMLLRLFRMHDNKARTVQMRGKWVDIEPAGWPDSLKLKVKTGLGVGAATERIGMLMSVITLQKEAVTLGATFLVKPRDLYNAATELTKAMGFRGAKTFFQDPGDEAWPPAPPNPKILEHQRRVKEDDVRAQLDHLKLIADEREKEELAAFRRDELASKERLAQLQADTQLEVAQIGANARAQSGGSGE